jgi:threonine dehydrogenase-like Zn-dependent dehydrogenase
MGDTMHAIVNTGPGRLEWLELPTPSPGPGQALIRTAACGICASDLAMIAGWERTGFPAIPGHEWSGVVEAVGPGANPALVGRPCVANNHLSDGGEIGFEYPGGYGQFLLTEAAKIHPLPAGMSLAEAALIEPLAVCLHGRRRLGEGAAGPTLIIGDGPIGLLSLMLLQLEPDGLGRDVTLVGGRAARLALARELGAQRVVDYHAIGDARVSSLRRGRRALPKEAGESQSLPLNAEPEDALAVALVEANGGRFRTVIEASGSVLALNAGMAAVAHGGRVLVLGDYGNACADFEWVSLLHWDLSIIGSGGGAAETGDAVRLAASGNIPLARLVSHRLPAERFAEGMALTRDRDSGAIKVVLEWE